jgi:DNA ligase-1
MVKSLEGDAAKYVPDRRSREWWKLKKDYMEGMSDTFDVVILGAWLGRGKRHGGYGAFMAACYNKETGMYESCSRLGSGFSEDQLVTLTAEMKKLVLPSKPNTFSVTINLALPHRP